MKEFIWKRKFSPYMDGMNGEHYEHFLKIIDIFEENGDMFERCGYNMDDGIRAIGASAINFSI